MSLMLFTRRAISTTRTKVCGSGLQAYRNKLVALASGEILDTRATKLIDLLSCSTHEDLLKTEAAETITSRTIGGKPDIFNIVARIYSNPTCIRDITSDDKSITYVDIYSEEAGYTLRIKVNNTGTEDSKSTLSIDNIYFGKTKEVQEHHEKEYVSLQPRL